MPDAIFRFFPAALLAASLAAQAQLESFPAPFGSSNRSGGPSMALLDDLDRDGLRDVAISVETSSRAWIEVRSSDSGAVLFAIAATTTDASDMSLAAIDDLDGDGVRDLLAGYPNHSTGALERGLVEIYSGRTGLKLRSHVGGAAGDHLGTAVCSIGDADLDGVPDYAMGAPGFDAQPVFGLGVDSGAVYYHSGATGALLSQPVSPAGSMLGTSLAPLGDLDGDGSPSCAMGAPGIDRVAIWEVLGNSSVLVLTGFAGSSFGFSLASVADLDGDGLRDLIVGQPGYVLFPLHTEPAGRVAAFGSVSGGQLFSIAGSIEGYRLGHDVGELGDVNGDGVSDVVASAKGELPPFGLPAEGRMVFLSGANGSVLEVFDALGESWSFAVAEDADQDGRADVWMFSSWFGQLFRRGDPGSSQDWTAYTTVAGGQRFGESVAMLDDLDGDGRPEVAVGGPHCWPGNEIDQGCVRVYSGTNVLYSYDGRAMEQLGAAVVALDDLDGDGVGEFAIGRPRGKFGQNVVGAVSIYSGATGLLLRNHFGLAYGDRFGAAIARVPDTDGDGVDDYAIGAPAVSAGGLLGVGRVRLYSGDSGAQRFGLQGTIVNGAFGAALAGSEDLNGDGYGELLVGAPGEWTTIFNIGAGRVHRYSGWNGSLLGTIVGTQARMQLGSSLASVGDLNGDGRAEFVIGAPFYASTVAGDGRVQVHDGGNGALLASDAGVFGSRLGAAVVGCGDTDNDGVPDFAVGEPRAVDFPNPEVTGRVRVYSGATSTFYQALPGSEQGSRFGGAVASGGDLDGDRMPDVVVGVPGRFYSYASNQASMGAMATWTVREIGSQAFGTGTAGCAGDHNLTLYRTVTPGLSMQVRYSGMSPLTFPILAAGPAVPGGVPVLGCLLHVVPDVTIGLALPAGSHGVHVEPMPNDPGIIGAQLDMQVFALWLGGCGVVPFDLSSSNGLTMTVQ